jgi:SNF2 family DNA or RNA helicase
LDDPGLGKTIQAIVAADRSGVKTALVACPGIARWTWQREWQDWQQIDRSIQVIESSADAQNLRADVVMVSYSLLPRIRALLCARSWDVLVCDEGQHIKAIDAARTKAVYGPDGVARRAKRTWILSGTLAPNHPGELWPHYRCLFHGELTYWKFVERYCVIKQTPFGQQIVGANLARTAELAAFLRPHVLQRRQQDVLADLPPLRWGHIPVSPSKVPPKPDLSIQEKAILGKIERDEAFSVIESMHLATLRRWTGVAKAVAVVELVNAELESVDKVVVFAVHREVISILAAGIVGGAVIDGSTPQSARQALIDNFQNTDQPRVLILQIQIAGTAITLHRASRCVFAETTWVPADVAQCAKRLHRIGQHNSVLASVVSLAGSIDEKVAGVLTRKASELAKLESLIGAAA